VTPEELALAIRTALVAAVAAGDLVVDVPDEVRIERPRNREHGDWSTNVALQIAKGAGMPPREVASALAVRLGELSGIKTVDIAGPGLSQHHARRRGGRRARPDDRRGGAGLRSWRRGGGPPDQPGVRLGQPDRPDPPRQHAMGRRR